MSEISIGSSAIVSVNAQNFQDEVVEFSKQTPVFLEFYADGAEPSEQLSEILIRLAEEYKGKFRLARLDIQESPQLVQQLGIRGLPTLKVIFQGQIVQNLEGPQEETLLRQLLDELTQSPVERIREQIDQLLAMGDRNSAIELLRQLTEEEPNNHGLQVEMADLLIMEGQEAEARQIIATLPEDADGINKPKNRLAFMAEAADLPGADVLRITIESSPDDLMAQQHLAIRLIADDQIEEALGLLLDMMKEDRHFEEGLAQKTLVKVFDLLGKGNPLATEYRRKMFSLLH